MSGLLLTREERERFAAWLEREAHSGKLMIEQLLKLGPHGDVLAQRERIEVAAAEVIARKLRSIEDMSIGG